MAKNPAAHVAVAALAMAAAAAGFVYAGCADVAATTPHGRATAWLLSTAMERAVAKRAATLHAPPSLDGPERLGRGAAAFDAMCAACHGAPGVAPDPVGKGLNPPPPDLAEAASSWTVAEIFWITKHGVRMTGMPAFGPTHADDAIWEVAAFVARLPELSPERYRELARMGHPADGHRHVHRAEAEVR